MYQPVKDIVSKNIKFVTLGADKTTFDVYSTTCQRFTVVLCGDRIFIIRLHQNGRK